MADEDRRSLTSFEDIAAWIEGRTGFVGVAFLDMRRRDDVSAVFGGPGGRDRRQQVEAFGDADMPGWTGEIAFMSPEQNWTPYGTLNDLGCLRVGTVHYVRDGEDGTRAFRCAVHLFRDDWAAMWLLERIMA